MDEFIFEFGSNPMSYLTINKTFKSSYSKEELLILLKASEESAKAGGFYCKKAGDDFKINARFSLGTLHFSGGFGNSIGVRLKLLSQSDSIRVFTKVRPEHFFILLIFGLFFFIQFLSQSKTGKAFFS